MSAGLKANADGSIEILANGATKIKVNADGGVNTSTPVFSAYISAAQTFPNAVLTKAQFNVAEIDSHGYYDAVNYRFKPLVAGYYLVSATISGYVASGAGYISIAKNGTEYKRGQQITAPTASSVDCIVYLNGSTDYVEAHAFAATGQAGNAGATLNHFEGYLVRAA